MKKTILYSIVSILGLTSALVAYAITWPPTGLVRNPDIIMTPPAYQPSGLAWNPVTKKLLTVCNTGQVTIMNLDGTGQVNKTTGYYDFEGITIVDPNSNIVFLGDENPDKIMEYNLTTGLTKREWDLRSVLTGADNQGMEGLTFVPNGYHPYPNSASGGLFYAGVQRSPNLTDTDPNNNYLLYAFDIDLNTSGKIVNWYGIKLPTTTPQSDISDLYFSKDTNILYVLFDGANRLVELKTDGTLIKDYSGLTTALTVEEQEGIVVMASYPKLTADIYLASDTQKKIGWFSGYPVDYDYDKDGVKTSVDCNDKDASVSQNKTYYKDLDGDGVGTGTAESICSATAPSKYTTNSQVDCNDNDGSVSATKIYYPDADGDGQGFGAPQSLCKATAPVNYSINNFDLNDNDFDNDNVVTSLDCNDKDITVWNNLTLYKDLDGDGVGTGFAESICSATAPTGYVATSNVDCNDNDKTVFANQTYYKDLDGDGVGTGVAESICSATAPAKYTTNSQVDCNDNDNSVSATKVYYTDADGDGQGFGAPQNLCKITAPTNYSVNNTDLNDNDFDNDNVITSLDCNDKDRTVWNNQTYYKDSDGDGYGTGLAEYFCKASAPVDYTANSTVDCNDDEANIFAYQTYHQDLDKDDLGYGAKQLFCSLTPPAGYVTNNLDKNDSDHDNDGVTMRLDCDDNNALYSYIRVYYLDADKDGYGSILALTDTSKQYKGCIPSRGYVSNATDINDNNPRIH